MALQACARALLNPTATGSVPEPPTGPAETGTGGDPGRRRTGHLDGEHDVTEAAAGGAPDSVLSGRELEIGTLVLAGLTYKQIGEQLFISAKTVEHHVARIRGRLGVTSRNELFGRLRSLV